MTILKKIIHYVAIICLLMVGLYAIAILPMVLGYKPLIVLNDSMEPTYKVGGLIYYKSIEKEDIKEGDIVTFESFDGQYISHRVVKIVNGMYEIKGDASDDSKSIEVSYNSILGKNTNFCIPYIGYYIQFFNKNIYLVFVFGLVFVIEFFMSNMGKKKAKEVRTDLDGI